VRKKIFLDLDGVFANFDGKVTELTGNKYRERDSNDIWNVLDKIPNLFSQLELIPGSLKIITMLQHHNLEFLTALPMPTGELKTADADKREWIAKNISRTIPVNTIVGGKNKWKFLIENPSAVLIDDYARNIQLWNASSGVGVLHTDVESTLAKLDKLNLL
jgi:hypothetical protein